MWMDLPVWLRLCIALGLFALGGALIYFGAASGRYRLRFAFAIIGLGFAALIFSTKTDSEKKGYRF
jgi:hypothetical protein